MQIGDPFGIVVASLVLFFPLADLDKAYHFGSAALPAPQAGLMAMLSKGIVGGDMAWPLVIVRYPAGLAMILIEVKSVMLFAVGMYLPLGTTFAIFVGGVIRWVTDRLRDRRGLNDAQKARVDNAGVLTASGMIAGEALCGLVIAGWWVHHENRTLLGSDAPVPARFGCSRHAGHGHDPSTAVASCRTRSGRSRAANGDHVIALGSTSRPAAIILSRGKDLGLI